jgi:hypothetical protein
MNNLMNNAQSAPLKFVFDVAYPKIKGGVAYPKIKGGHKHFGGLKYSCTLRICLDYNHTMYFMI